MSLVKNVNVNNLLVITRVRRNAPPHWSCSRQLGMTDGESGANHDEIWRQRGEIYRVSALSANTRTFLGSGAHTEETLARR